MTRQRLGYVDLSVYYQIINILTQLLRRTFVHTDKTPGLLYYSVLYSSHAEKRIFLFPSSTHVRTFGVMNDEINLSIGDIYRHIMCKEYCP